MNLDRILNLEDFTEVARRRLPRSVYQYICSVAEDGLTYRANADQFKSTPFVPRVLVDTTSRSLTTHLWGEEWSAPFGIAPMGAVAFAAFDGDVQLAAAARDENIPFVLSGASLTPMEKIIEVNPRAWFQIYASTVEEENLAVLQRAKSAGYKTLVVTVDVPVAGTREGDRRAGYSSPLKPSAKLMFDGVTHPRWVFGILLRTVLTGGMPTFTNLAIPRVPMITFRKATTIGGRDNLSWDHLARMRDMWPGKLVIKGVSSAQDALIAKNMGVDAVQASNHGGRQLDGAIAPLEALRSMRREAPHTTLFSDGGIRRGSHVLQSIATGASMTFLGRPFFYAVAGGGQDAVVHAIRILRAEMLRSMALLGILKPDQS